MEINMIDAPRFPYLYAVSNTAPQTAPGEHRSTPNYSSRCLHVCGLHPSQSSLGTWSGGVIQPVSIQLSPLFYCYYFLQTKQTKQTKH